MKLYGKHFNLRFEPTSVLIRIFELSFMWEGSVRRRFGTNYTLIDLGRNRLQYSSKEWLEVSKHYGNKSNKRLEHFRFPKY